jgi:translation initiation factor 1
MPGLFDGTPLQQPVTCEHCGHARDACVCPRDASGEACPPATQHPRVRREKRRGKPNTIIADVLASPDRDAKPGDLKPLLKSLKARFGTGGGLGESTNGPEIVLQGDHRDAVVEHLNSLGYCAKPAGG